MDAGLGDLWGLFPSFQRNTHILTNLITPKTNYPDIQTLAPLVIMHVLDPKFYFYLAKTQGYSEDMANFFIDRNITRLPPSDYVTLWRRGELSEKDLEIGLRLNQFVDKDIDLIKKVTEYFPQVQDVIRFAVREVYSPKIAEKYGQFEDFPTQFITESKKLGLSEQNAKNYWAAHWELPSISMGFEMFHRQTENPEKDVSDEIIAPNGSITHNIIGKESLAQLLRSLDVMPYWREKLIELSYSPLTRVDVRRMYGLGVINADEVFKNYLDQGYSQTNAKLMTDFTVKYESNEFDGITRATLVNGYIDGIIKLDELESYLSGIGYAEKTIQFWLSQAQYEKVMNDMKIMTDDLIERYQMGAITLEQVRTELLDMDVPSDYIESVISKIIKVKAKRTKVPSLDDLKGWLRGSLIDEKYFTEKMRLLGYKDSDIQIYLSEIAKELDTSKVKYLPFTVYVRWVENGIMSPNDFIDTLIKMGMTEKDITKLLDEMEKKQNESKEQTTTTSGS
ncbi:MAG: hypothetical protein PHI02_09300 [Sulfurovaceae bacterium]|nr:hypothetical protein [Sulfurovaceae bacterium]